MGRPKKEQNIENSDHSNNLVTPNDLGWTDHVLGLLHDDEKINGNPTTDGLRRIFETVLNCTIINNEAQVVQTPDLSNEGRATVIYKIDYLLNDVSVDHQFKHRSVSAAADVYWGNCDKVFRNHPVAVAETRAEGRALRKGLKLRKVVTADEIAKEVVDHSDDNNNTTINNSQLNFIDVFGKRLNINIKKLLHKLDITYTSVYNISYDNAVKAITSLSSYQQNQNISEDILGYDPNWK